MSSQTIALFRYLMLGIQSRKFAVLYAILLLTAALAGSFVGELALINSHAVVAAFVADFLRYSLGLLMLLVVVNGIADDYEFRQFERLLTMPLARWQYIAAQVLVIASISVILTLPTALLLAFYADAPTSLYWAAALWLELFLLGTIGLLAGLSLEKIPLAMFFALAVYLLAKLAGMISLIVSETVDLAEGSVGSRVIEQIFDLILYLLPGNEAFAETDVFFRSFDLLATLGEQLLATSIYVLFLLAVSLVEFYRKEFNI